MKKICINCNKEYEATRETSKYCSTKCRVAYSRTSVNQANEWHNSSVTKTQEQIESHYTMRNFKPVKYGNAYSPYPKSNPLSRAYLPE